MNQLLISHTKGVKIKECSSESETVSCRRPEEPFLERSRERALGFEGPLLLLALDLWHVSVLKVARSSSGSTLVSLFEPSLPSVH